MGKLPVALFTFLCNRVMAIVFPPRVGKHVFFRKRTCFVYGRQTQVLAQHPHTNPHWTSVVGYDPNPLILREANCIFYCSGILWAYDDDDDSWCRAGLERSTTNHLVGFV